jgi:hypothetical protein
VIIAEPFTPAPITRILTVFVFILTSFLGKLL